MRGGPVPNGPIDSILDGPENRNAILSPDMSDAGTVVTESRSRRGSFSHEDTAELMDLLQRLQLSQQPAAVAPVATAPDPADRLRLPQSFTPEPPRLHGPDPSDTEIESAPTPMNSRSHLRSVRSGPRSLRMTRGTPWPRYVL